MDRNILLSIFLSDKPFFKNLLKQLKMESNEKVKSNEKIYEPRLALNNDNNNPQMM